MNRATFLALDRQEARDESQSTGNLALARTS